VRQIGKLVSVANLTFSGFAGWECFGVRQLAAAFDRHSNIHGSRHCAEGASKLAHSKGFAISSHIGQ
jgi:hypothetical protein